MNPTPLEMHQCHDRANEEYIEVLILRKADPKQYGMLLANIQNNHTRSADQYPKTMTKEYEIIVNYKNPKATTRFDRQDHGMFFYNEDKKDNNSNTNKQQQSQQGGRCGHGHGRSSRWSQGEKGRGYGQGNENGNIHINEEEDNKEDDMLKIPVLDST